MLWLTEQILKAHKDNGFVSAIVFGPQGRGKTTYAIKVAREVYKELGYGKGWDQALKHLFFELPEAIPALKEAYLEKKRIPVIIFDDASIWFDKYSWRSETSQKFFKIYALARTLTAGIIFTTPSPDDIAKFLREKSWKKIKIVRYGYKNGHPRALAKLYKYEIEKGNSDFKGVVKWEAVDEFIVHLPDKVYKQYLERRDRAIKRLLEDIEEVFKEYTEENTIPVQPTT